MSELDLIRRHQPRNLRGVEAIQTRAAERLPRTHRPVNYRSLRPRLKLLPHRRTHYTAVRTSAASDEAMQSVHRKADADDIFVSTRYRGERLRQSNQLQLLIRVRLAPPQAN